MTYRGFRKPRLWGPVGGVKRDHLQTYERSIASSKETPKNDKDGTGLWFSENTLASQWVFFGSMTFLLLKVFGFAVLSLEWRAWSQWMSHKFFHNLGKLANLLPVSYWLDSCIASNKLIALYRWELPLKASLSHILKMFQILLQVALFKVGK